jgi:hypothetical protein
MAHAFSLNFLFNFYLSHNYCSKPRSQEQKKYPGKPYSTREENPANPLLYSSRERPPTPSPNLAHEGAVILIISDHNF